MYRTLPKKSMMTCLRTRKSDSRDMYVRRDRSGLSSDRKYETSEGQISFGVSCKNLG